MARLELAAKKKRPGGKTMGIMRKRGMLNRAWKVHFCPNAFVGACLGLIVSSGRRRSESSGLQADETYGRKDIVVYYIYSLAVSGYRICASCVSP